MSDQRWVVREGVELFHGLFLRSLDLEDPRSDGSALVTPATVTWHPTQAKAWGSLEKAEGVARELRENAGVAAHVEAVWV